MGFYERLGLLGPTCIQNTQMIGTQDPNPSFLISYDLQQTNKSFLQWENEENKLT